MKLEETVSDMRERVSKVLHNLREVLAGGTEENVEGAKAALAKHVGKLVLTPGVREGRPVYKVSGALAVEGEAEKYRIHLVARDGYPQHSTLLSIPLLGLYLDPRRGERPSGRRAA